MTARAPTRQTYLNQACHEYASQLGRIKYDESLAYARSYLNSHGVTPRMAEKYNLGLVTSPLPGDTRFYGALSIPYLSPNGVTAIRFRMFSGDDKIAQHGGQKNRLYIPESVYRPNVEVVGLAEGEMDALVATEYLGLPTMGYPGAKNFKPSWKRIFKDYTTVFIFADGDKPGRDAASEVADLLGWRAQIITCGEGEDLSSLAAKSNLDMIRESITTSNQEV